MLVSCISLSSCARDAALYEPAKQVKASESLRIAEAYRVHQWTPSKFNVFHGKDTTGVLVHTPDISMPTGPAPRPGWWKLNVKNQGIPYQWGSFDTPLSFDEKIGKGFYAGDVYTKGKRTQLYAAVSPLACGVDCSGFVSRYHAPIQHVSYLSCV